MIICLCNGITENQIRKSIRTGNWSCAKVSIDCGAGSGCGICRKEICKMVDEEKRKRVLDAVEGLANGVNSSLDEIRKAVGDLTVNDILDLVSEALDIDEEPKEDGEEKLQ